MIRVSEAVVTTNLQRSKINDSRAWMESPRITELKKVRSTLLYRHRCMVLNRLVVNYEQNYYLEKH